MLNGRAITTGKSSEMAAKMALQELQTKNVLSKKTVGTIYSEAFAASQLDGQPDALFDAVGGRRDKTVAVAAFQQALDIGSQKITQIEIGELKAPTRNITELPKTRAK